MTNKRKERRVYAPDVLPVKDQASHLTIGFLRDLSLHGMKLTGKGPFTEGKQCKLIVVLPRSVMGKRSVELMATCKWKTKTAKRDVFDAGFLFGQLTENQELLILLVQAEYAVRALDDESVVESNLLSHKV
jgi:hypothetical protein